MSNWRTAGNTSVITGGASGLGLEAARRCVTAGMNVVIADRNESGLASASEQLSGLAASADAVLAQPCDVSDRDDVDRLCELAYARFGAVHCLMNNAGSVFPAGKAWENAAELEKTLAINLWGVMHGCQAFIPRMLESEEPGVIINTGSKQGITRPPGNFAYNLSKAGVFAYTESVAYGLRQEEGCQLSAHLLVPGFVYTPMVARFLPEQPPGAWTAAQTIDFMLPRVDAGDFYIICPDNESPRELDEARMQWTADDAIRNRPALSRWHPDFADEYEAFIADANSGNP